MEEQNNVDGSGDLSEPFGPEWEDRTRRNLESTGYDPELAMRVSRDALLVLTGQLSEDEFHARHRETYLQQFGQDDRPRFEEPSPSSDDGVAPDSRELVSAAASSGDAAPERPALITRRTALRLGGAGAAALLIGDMFGGLTQRTSLASTGHDINPLGAGKAAAPSKGGHGAPAKPTGVQMGMVIDVDRCDGCLLCVGGCKQFNGNPDGVHWMYVLAYKEPDEDNQLTHLLPRTCQHCTKAPCVMVCPTAARHKTDHGLVLTDYGRCIGCRYCQVSCPYGVNYFQWAESSSYGGSFDGESKDARGKLVEGDPPRGVMGKCTFHPKHEDGHHKPMLPPCALACPHGVLHYGDLNDPESEPNRYLAKRRAENNGRLSTFRLLEDLGTQPNVIYIGRAPTRHAQAVDGPTRYEDWGLVEQRATVLESPDAWFNRSVKNPSVKRV